MRYFNTSGPCKPEKHYTVMREVLIAQGKKMVEDERYFTIFAPRQAGKTTYFQLLIQKLHAEQSYTPIWISFEHLKAYSKQAFYHDMTHQFEQELSDYTISVEKHLSNQPHLIQVFETLRESTKPLVLFIDEFEGIPDHVLSELMHTFRMIYHRKQYYGLHSVILVGVSTVAELVVSSASPFNVVDELAIPYFTCDEVQELITQYVTESGQVFREEVIRAIYHNTQGQPGLVCGLCRHLTEKLVTDRSQPVTMDDFYATLQYFLTRKFDKNIDNIVRKAREKRAFMMKVLFKDAPIPFSVHEPDIAWLFAHGVVDDVNGYVGVSVPLYRKVLITAFRPAINGEIDYYVSAHDTFNEYISPEGLHIHALLNKYREYVRRRGFRAFDTEHLKEGAWHYSLDGFINFFIEQLGGHTFIETPTSRGRTDILIIYQKQKYVIETKIFTTNYSFQKGKAQLTDYLASEGLQYGYYVVFSNKHSEEDQLYFEEEVNGKQIYTSIICTTFERATEKSPSV